MIQRLEQLLEEIAKEPLELKRITEKEMEFFNLVGLLNKNPRDYNLYFYYIKKLNEVENFKYSKRKK